MTREQDHYICPAGNILTPANYRKAKGQVIGRDYRNSKVCSTCELGISCFRSANSSHPISHGKTFVTIPDSFKILKGGSYSAKRLNISKTNRITAL